MDLTRALLEKKEKLNKIEKNEPKSFSFVPENLSVEDDAEYERRIRMLDFQNWYQMIEKETFVTSVFPLTRSDCLALLDAHKNFEKSKIVDKKALESLVQRVDNAMDQLRKHIRETYGRNPTGWFVKSSCRSPKDSAFYHPNLKSRYEELAQNKAKESNKTVKDLPPNDKVVALMQSVRESMEVRSGDEAIDMFVKSSRIFEDLTAVLDSKLNPQLANCEGELDFLFVIREWRPIPLDMEFRAFCKDGKINAITQYDWFIYFQRLPRLKERIEASLQKYYRDQVIPLLNTKPDFPTEYVVDFAIPVKEGKQVEVEGEDLDGENLDWDHPIVIELNPFHSSQTGLFDREQDSKTLMGQKEFELRVAKEPISDLRIGIR
eukprot:TRINITY_DN9510_c0_g1_i1.p1 TRINITY_DN9510_c0_g1~~TRINITY_DN9510_c0_g1_i1.p1  ORF type:complete len:391 (+),score=114.49 TRINITY_DN9510_c0_g1_i1:43-1173(+)